MKIAFIVNTFPTLSETFILNQITGLLDLGHNVDIFARNNPEEEKIHSDVVKYHLLDRSRYFEPSQENKLKRVFRTIGVFIKIGYRNPIILIRSLCKFKHCRNECYLNILYPVLLFLNSPKYDIVHCHFGPNGNLGILLQGIEVIKGKIITEFYGYDLSMYIESHKNNVYTSLFEKGDLSLPISENFKKKLIRLGCSENKIIVHRIGIKLDRFKFSPRRKSKEEVVKLLTVARLTEKKGIKYGIQAVVKILRELPKLEYKIVGDGDLKPEIENLINKHGVKEKIELLGAKNQNEIIGLIENSDIFMLPSVTARNGDQEGTPVVLMEAQASGLPVLSTQHSGIPEVVQNGKSGFLVPERDVDALAERLEYLIKRPEIWPEMGRVGRKFVEEHYNINKLNKQLVEIYQKLIKDQLP